MTNKEFAKHFGIELGKQYNFMGKVVIPFDAEKEINQLGISSGFIHFREGDKVRWCGMNYFKKNMIPV